MDFAAQANCINTTAAATTTTTSVPKLALQEEAAGDEKMDRVSHVLHGSHLMLTGPA